MHIAFLDFTGIDYTAASPDQIPLGGSQSALCRLSVELVRRGHRVDLLNWTSNPGKHLGVRCLHRSVLTTEFFRSPAPDVVIILNGSGLGRQLRDHYLDPRTPLVLWTQQATDQPDALSLKNAAERSAYSAFAFVSEWQRDQYVRDIGVDPSIAVTLRNAPAPAFQQLFTADESILDAKPWPPVFAYTSTPFRGLEVLVQVFPYIREAFPGTKLKVFSDMRVYQSSAEQEAKDFGSLYDRCRATEGIEYVGTLPQPELAKELRLATALAYPNTFSETSCIAVMEALAAGCWVVSRELGALPETCSGFGTLTPAGLPFEKFVARFAGDLANVIRSFGRENRTDLEQRLRQQVNHFSNEVSWPARAAEWENWLATLVASTVD